MRALFCILEEGLQESIGANRLIYASRPDSPNRASEVGVRYSLGKELITVYWSDC